MSGRTININIPPDSRKWLFTDPNDLRPDAGRLWSLGRFRPKCDAGDEIYFRFDGEIVAAATVDEVYKPGLLNTVCHHGGRYLSGWKVTWLNNTFVDLRDCKVFGELSVACNDEHGNSTGNFSQVSLRVGRWLDDPDAIDLEGGDMSIDLIARHFLCTPPTKAIRLGRRKYSIKNYSTQYGNMFWDMFSVSLMDATAILNQLLDADFGINVGPTALYDKQYTVEPFTWRDLLAATAAEAQ